ncbi:MAG: DNA (cytosine-5-)-methyltransferase, partial [Opitutales bacterium]|nr:DNA (cytosine-5-)-methyltransferase [Opitutales bacterium]
MFTFIDLFAGIGGFRIGLERLGGKCVFSSEIDKHAAATYER